MIWKLLHWASWIVFVPFIGLFLWSLISKKNGPAQPIAQNAGRLRFPKDSVQVWLQYLLGADMLLFAAECFRQGFHSSWTFLEGVLTFLTGMGALLVDSSASIVVGDTGIEDVHWLGRNKFIRWEDIEEINIGKQDRVITIRSKERTKIVYTMRPENQAQFLYEIKQHCGSELPPEFPGESSWESESH